MQRRTLAIATVPVSVYIPDPTPTPALSPLPFVIPFAAAEQMINSRSLLQVNGHVQG